MMKKLILTLLCSAVFWSCEDDVQVPFRASTSLQKATRIHADTYGTTGIVEFSPTYSGGRISELRNAANNQAYFFTYNSDGKIAEKEYIVNQGTANEKSRKTVYVYTSGKLEEEIRYDKPVGATNYSELYQYDFVYQSSDPNKIEKILKIVPTPLNSGQPYTVLGFALVQYTGNNISKIDATNLNNRVYNYTSNTNVNLTHNLLPNLYTFSLYMDDTECTLIPFLTNPNIVSSASYTNVSNGNSESYNITYTFDNQTLLEINNGFSPLVKYTYQ